MPATVDAPVGRVTTSVFRIPTDGPEADGTFTWDATTIVVVELEAGDESGLGYTYGPPAVAGVIEDLLAEGVEGSDALAVPGTWAAMVAALRNAGRPGIGAMAVAAVDAALWDAKGRLLGLPLVDLLGPARDAVDVYGSGGFTSYPEARLVEQLAGWVADGIPRVKMKIGRDADADRRRVTAARRAIGADPELFVDANGAYDTGLALAQAAAFADQGVTWFEEPVPSADTRGLAHVRAHVPPGMDVAGGEYGSDLADVRRLLEADAVDCLQVDASRCSGITGFLRAAAACETMAMPLSAHCAPALHVHPACVVGRIRHVEYFHDHVRIERLLFDGVTAPVDGKLAPDRSRPGLGLELRRADADRYRI
jgi:L-alanine-DL-glutamate epimerase-like enolase superfamily enzyme